VKLASEPDPALVVADRIGDPLIEVIRDEVKRDSSGKFEQKRRNQEPEESSIPLPGSLSGQDWERNEDKDRRDEHAAPGVIGARLHQQEYDDDEDRHDDSGKAERRFRAHALTPVEHASAVSDSGVFHHPDHASSSI
jgi:hypothetical protein